MVNNLFTTIKYKEKKIEKRGMLINKVKSRYKV